MERPGGLKVAALGEREILMTREFDASVEMVFDAFTKPELLRRWLLGPDGWVMSVCEVDLKVGGKYRYVWTREKSGEGMGMGGDYREISKPKRIVATEIFDQAWYPGVAVSTLELSALGANSGKTSMKQTLAYESREARDGVLKSPMEQGLEMGYARLDALFSPTGSKA
jgi:uncharacterized protein YndB with AHSA1/START domain